MDRSRISLNLESLQDRMNGTKQILASLTAIRAAGFKYVEILHCQNPDAGISWRTVLDTVGLKVSSTHELFDEIKKRPDTVIRKALDLDCKYVVAGLAQSTVWDDPASVKKLVQEMNILNNELRAAGLQLLYHNHNMEFAKISSSQNCLEYIFNEADPTIGAELDIYWVQLSGGNPEHWCKHLKGRLKAVHLKDLGVFGGSFETYIKTPMPTVLGGGNLAFKEILSAAEESGNEWYIIETHTNWVDGDSIKTASMSFDYLRQLAVPCNKNLSI